jgi:aspartyl-tRNA(Asn)/glutamyl-tRNA(Gln) amidotransferase subunit C
MADDFRQEVDRVARLARLQLDDAEKEQMAAELSAILAMARRVQEVDTAGVIPAAQTITQPAALREDEVQPSLPLNRVFQNAPLREKNYFRVPPVVAGDEAQS